VLFAYLRDAIQCPYERICRERTIVVAFRGSVSIDGNWQHGRMLWFRKVSIIKMEWRSLHISMQNQYYPHYGIQEMGNDIVCSCREYFSQSSSMFAPIQTCWPVWTNPAGWWCNNARTMEWIGLSRRVW
jgi:hypothetical protein